jgi:hypothetical protein
MEELKKLFDEQKWSALAKLCGKKISGGDESMEVYAYLAFGEAGRNGISKLTLDDGTEAFKKAGSLCKTDEEKKWLYETFVNEVEIGIERADRELSSASMTKELVEGYWGTMQNSAEAFAAAAEFGGGIGVDPLPAEKRAVYCLSRLCAAQDYESDMGKNIVKGTYNVPNDTRNQAVAMFDGLVEKIKAAEPSYTAPEILRECKSAPAADGGAPRKSLMEQFFEYLKKRKKK